MFTLKNIIGGLSGAIALNIVHQSATHLFADAPRVDLVGEEALNKGLKKAGMAPLRGEELFGATLAGDLLSNTLYYSLVGAGRDSHLLARGAGYGLMAGVGALTLTRPLGLDDKPVNKTTQTKALTLAWYTLGGMVAALTIKALKS